MRLLVLKNLPIVQNNLPLQSPTNWLIIYAVHSNGIAPFLEMHEQVVSLRLITKVHRICAGAVYVNFNPIIDRNQIDYQSVGLLYLNCH